MENKRTKQFLRKLGSIVIALALLSTVLIFFRKPLLTGAASLWICPQKPTDAQAIYILGGGLETRPFVAASLFKSGYASKILIPKVAFKRSEKLKLTLGDTEAAYQILLSEGVPTSAIEIIDQEVTSTYEEAVALRAWLAKDTASYPSPRRILIPTEELHTRRTQWVFQKVIGVAAQPIVVNGPHPDFAIQNWWQSEQGLITFQNEIAKTAYYFWKY